MDPVIVAGAGPVGLTLALALARHEVPVILLDEGGPRPDAAANPARSVVLRPHTADLLSRLGYDRVRTDAARWTAWRTRRRRQDVQYVCFEAESEAESAGALLPARRSARSGGTRESVPAPAAEPPSPSPFHLTQEQLCRGLRTALAERGLVAATHHARLDRLEQDQDGVSAHTRAGAGAPDTWWRGSYLVGCDGPRSTVRKLLDVRFAGRTAVDRYAVAALRVDLPEPGTAVLHRDAPGVRGREVTARPLPGGAWRVDWSLRPDGPPLTADALVAHIRATLAAWCAGTVPPYELLGSAEYPVHQRLARTWRLGRAFLAGDAAHLLGSLGTQSLEEGLLDADNLAWKLALAWHHGAGDALLDSYEAERRHAVGSRLRAADQAFPLVRSGGALHSLRRSLLSGASSRHGHLLTDAHLGNGLLGAPPVYARSPLTAPAARPGRVTAPTGTVPGAVVHDVPIVDLDGAHGRLSDRLGRHLLALLVAPGTGVWEHRHWLTAGLMPRLSAAVASLPTRTELLVTESYPGATAHAVLLIRPDGHLVAAMTGCRPAELHAYATLAGGGSLPADGILTAPEPGAR